MALTLFVAYTAAPAGAVTGPAADARDDFNAATTNRSSDGLGSQALGSAATLSLLSGQATLTFDYLRPPLSRSPGIVANAASDPPSNGRFDCTGDGPGRWAISSRSISIALSPARQAFGIFVVDFGDFLAGLEIELVRSDDQTQVIDVYGALPPGIPDNGALMFVGFADDAASYKEVRLKVEQIAADPDDWDFLGYDDLVVADAMPAPPPPPPPPPPPAPAPELSVSRGWGASGNVVTIQMIAPTPEPAPPPPA